LPWLFVWQEVHRVHNYKKPKIFSEKQKGFRDGLSYSTPQKSEEARGNAITQPRSHSIKKIEMGWEQGWVMAFPLEGWSMTAHPLIHFCFSEIIIFLLLVCELIRAQGMHMATS